jgi:hypothetical protein
LTDTSKQRAIKQLLGIVKQLETGDVTITSLRVATGTDRESMALARVEHEVTLRYFELL